VSVVVIGTVSGTSAVAIGVTVVATLVVVALALAARSLIRTAGRLRLLAEELETRSASVLGEVEDTVRQAREELARVDDLVGSAEAISDRVGSASRLAQTAVSAPLIKAVAFGAGTARAGRRLRDGTR
jgi:hypothetical protein